MRSTLISIGAGCVLIVSAMFPQSDTRAALSARPGSAASAPRASTGTRDPRAYFTDTELVTQDGRKVRFYSDVLKDRVAVVNVIYTSCKDACPLITRQLVQVRDELADLFGRKVFFVSITSDPRRDTPAAMKRFARKHDADVAGWTFLTGAEQNVRHILKRLGALPADVEDHITALYILDVDNKRMRRMLPNLPPRAIAEAARIIAGAEERAAGADAARAKE